MHRIAVAEATAHLPELIQEAVGGGTVVIVGNDDAAVRLVPDAPAAKQPRFGSARGHIKMAEDFDAPLDGFEDYMA